MLICGVEKYCFKKLVNAPAKDPLACGFLKNELLFEAFVAGIKKKVSFRLSFNIFKWQMIKVHVDQILTGRASLRSRRYSRAQGGSLKYRLPKN